MTHPADEDFDLGYKQGWHEAFDMCIEEARLWEIENDKSFANDPFNQELEGAKREIKAFKERMEEVLRTRGPR